MSSRPGFVIFGAAHSFYHLHVSSKLDVLWITKHQQNPSNHLLRYSDLHELQCHEYVTIVHVISHRLEVDMIKWYSWDFISS